MNEITVAPSNWDLQHICEQQWNEIEYLKKENDELKKDIAELSEMVNDLQDTFDLYVSSTLFKGGDNDN